MISALLNTGADVNAKAEDGITPLMRAAMSTENPEVISVLLQAGADVNAKDEDGWTSLMLAARNNSPEVISVLLKAGADVKVKSDTDGYWHLAGETALDIAKYNESIKGTQAMKELEEATNP